MTPLDDYRSTLATARMMGFRPTGEQLAALLSDVAERHGLTPIELALLVGERYGRQK